MYPDNHASTHQGDTPPSHSIVKFTSAPAPLIIPTKDFYLKINSKFDLFYNHPYTTFKKRTNLYKSVFFCFGVFFFFLCLLIALKIPNGNCHSFLSHCNLAKTIMTGIGGLLAFTALYMSFYLKAEHEAVTHIMRYAKKKISEIHTQRKHKRKEIRKETLRKIFRHIQQQRDHVHYLLAQITKETSCCAMTQEKLFNESLIHFAHAVESAIETAFCKKSSCV